VLRSFNRTSHGFGQLGLSVEQNRALGNYVFSPTDVGHFLDANLFGAPLSAYMTQRTGLEAFSNFEFSRPALIAVGVPIMILASIATHFNSRASVARQSPEAAANPQTAMMNRLALYIFPLGILVTGPFLPLAILLYWLANNIWTYGQQHYVFGKIEKEEEAKKREALERRAANAPAPGVKPNRPRKTQPAADTTGTTDKADQEDGTGSDRYIDAPDAGTPDAKPSPGSGPAGRTPRPGARPKNRKR
jgi:YidC/Oxa1 family membrane protein insertase